jgi:hypothetical protein
MFNRKPTIEEIRYIKQQLFNIFHTYTIDGTIDFDNFKQLQYKYQNQNDDDLVFIEAEPDEEKFFFNDEKEFFKPDDEFLSNQEILQLPDKTQFISDNLEKYLDEAKIFLNYLFSISPNTEKLINIIGYGRCLTTLKMLFLEQSYFPRTHVEEIFVQLLVDQQIIPKILSVFQHINHECSIDCGEHVNYMYYCFTCKAINVHQHLRKHETTTINDHIVYHYDKNGLIDDIIDQKRCFIFNNITFTSKSLINFRNYQHNLNQLEINKSLQYHKPKFGSITLTPEQEYDNIRNMKSNFKPIYDFEHNHELNVITKLEHEEYQHRIVNFKPVTQIGFGSNSNSLNLFSNNANVNSSTLSIFGSMSFENDDDL